MRRFKSKNAFAVHISVIDVKNFGKLFSSTTYKFFGWFHWIYVRTPHLEMSKTWGGRALCAQMDFTRKFEANAKCNNIYHVWSKYYTFLVLLKYHRHPWVNIFDTDISRCINTYIKVVYLAFFGIFMLLQMSVSKILAQGHLWYFKSAKIL